jgi:hypothetical protein
MDGGEGSCIEDGLVEGMTKASIKRRMRKKERGGEGVWFSGCCLLTTWLVVEIFRCASNLAE